MEIESNVLSDISAIQNNTSGSENQELTQNEMGENSDTDYHPLVQSDDT